LEPGTYSLSIDGFDGKRATIKVFRDGASQERAVAQVTTIEADEPAPKTAVKVSSKNGVYLLDKLVIVGEKTAFQFRN
jgi:hypothetical protein